MLAIETSGRRRRGFVPSPAVGDLATVGVQSRPARTGAGLHMSPMDNPNLGIHDYGPGIPMKGGTMHIYQHFTLRHLFNENKKALVSQYIFLYIAPTMHCGLGLFTARAVPVNGIVLDVHDEDYLATALPYAELAARGLTDGDIFQVGPDLFLPPYGQLDDFTNHSCEPNCGLRVFPSGFDMIALRDIAAGEELTYDYSTHLENPQETMTCRCGAPSCRGVIRSFSQLPALRRQQYLRLGIVAKFIADNATRDCPAS